MALPKLPKTSAPVGNVSKQKVTMGGVLKSVAKNYLKDEKDSFISSIKESVKQSLPGRIVSKTASIASSPVRAYKAIGKSYRRAKLAAQEELDAKNKSQETTKPKLLSQSQKEKLLKEFFIETGNYGVDFSTGENIQTPNDYEYYKDGEGSVYAVHKDDAIGKTDLLGLEALQSDTKATKNKKKKTANNQSAPNIQKIDESKISSSRGGRRENAGRPKGSKNKEKTISEFASVIGIDSKILQNIESNTQKTNVILTNMSKNSTDNDVLLGINKKILDSTEKTANIQEQTRQNDLEEQNMSLEDHEIQKQILEATKLAGSNKTIAEQKQEGDLGGIAQLITFLAPLLPYIAGIAAGIAGIWALVKAWQGNVNEAEKQYREVGNEGFNVGNTNILGDGEGGRPTDKNLKDDFTGRIDDYTGSDRKRLLLMNDPEINKYLSPEQKEEQKKVIEEQQKNPDKWLAPDGTLNVSNQNVQDTTNARKNKVDSASMEMHKESVDLKTNETSKQPVVIDASTNNTNKSDGGSKDVYNQKIFNTRNTNDSYNRKMMNDTNYPTNR